MATSRTNGPSPTWDASIARLDPARIEAALNREGERAMKRIGLQFEARAKKAISGKKYTQNSLVTEALKGASTPLVGGGRGGDLFAAITSKVSGQGRDLVLWVGVNRNAKTKDGKTFAPIARFLHDGASINVAQHPQIRIKVFAMLREVAQGKRPGNAAKARAILDGFKSRAGRNKAGSGASSKLIWVIPPRPFITDILKDPNFQILVGMELREAVRRALGKPRNALMGRAVSESIASVQGDIGGLS